MANQTKSRALKLDDYGGITFVPPTIGQCGPWLEVLSLRGSQVTRLPKEVSKLTRLRKLRVSQSSLRYIDEIGKVPSLRALYVQGTSIHSVRAIKDLINLEVMDISGTHVTDMAMLGNLTKLVLLAISGLHITDISVLRNMPNMRTLFASNTLVSDVSALSRQTLLTTLYLHKTHVSNLAPLANLTSMVYLSLSKTRAKNLRPLQGLAKLQYLYLQDTSVDDIGPLSKLVELRVLVLSRTSVADVRPVKNLVNLVELALDATKLTEVPDGVFTKLVKLYSLHLHFNQIEYISPDLALLVKSKQLKNEAGSKSGTQIDEAGGSNVGSIVSSYILHGVDSHHVDDDEYDIHEHDRIRKHEGRRKDALAGRRTHPMRPPQQTHHMPQRQRRTPPPPPGNLCLVTMAENPSNCSVAYAVSYATLDVVRSLVCQCAPRYVGLHSCRGLDAYVVPQPYGSLRAPFRMPGPSIGLVGAVNGSVTLRNIDIFATGLQRDVLLSDAHLEEEGELRFKCLNTSADDVVCKQLPAYDDASLVDNHLDEDRPVQIQLDFQLPGSNHNSNHNIDSNSSLNAKSAAGKSVVFTLPIRLVNSMFQKPQWMDTRQAWERPPQQVVAASGLSRFLPVNQIDSGKYIVKGNPAIPNVIGYVLQTVCATRQCGQFINPPHTHTHTHIHNPRTRALLLWPCFVPRTSCAQPYARASSPSSIDSPHKHNHFCNCLIAHLGIPWDPLHTSIYMQDGVNTKKMASMPLQPLLLYISEGVGHLSVIQVI